MSFYVLTEWPWTIHPEGLRSQLTAHIHNSIQGEWEWLCRATTLPGESINGSYG